MYKSFSEDKLYPNGSVMEDYSPPSNLNNYFGALGLSNGGALSSMIPNMAQGIPSVSPYISKINHVQILNDKLKALEQKNQSDSEYLDRYLKNSIEKLKQINYFTPINPESSSYASANESLPHFNTSFKPQMRSKPMQQYDLDSYDPRNDILGYNRPRQGHRTVPGYGPGYNTGISTGIGLGGQVGLGPGLSQSQTVKNRVSPQIVSQLRGDLFKTRDNINRMKNNLKSIKSVMFNKMEEMEEKQNVTLEKLRNVIMLAKKNALGNANNSNASRKPTIMQTTKNKLSAVQRNTLPRNNSNINNNNMPNRNYYMNNNNNNNGNMSRPNLNLDESGFFNQIAKIIDQKLIEHDMKKDMLSRSMKQSNSLPQINQR